MRDRIEGLIIKFVSMLPKTQRVCPRGHKYYKSSTCPVCPVCESEKKPEDGFMKDLAAPARRALENAGIKSLKKLAGFSKNKILQLHGMGPGSVSKLESVLKQNGLKFKED